MFDSREQVSVDSEESRRTAFVHEVGVRGSERSAGISEQSVAAAAQILQASPSFEPVVWDFSAVGTGSYLLLRVG